ncbi:MAG: AmmeMemoRadiSam system radical SAM enzyme [Nitrososphaeria archaeon]
MEKILGYRCVREGRLYQKMGDNGVKCLLCHRACFIKENGHGFCRTRTNIGGKLYTLVYGDISSLSLNPIEKKPFYHFFPGSEALTIGTWSCNFICPWCQNFSISRVYPKPQSSNYISPEDLVERAYSLRSQGTSFSFNEPTLLFEYALDVFPLAHKKKLYNTYVSNGYMSDKALIYLKEFGLDAIKFDIKGDLEVVRRYCDADLGHIWGNVKLAKRLGLHVELVNLIIPTVNDGEDIIKDVVEGFLKYAGEMTPLHFTRFFPSYKMSDVKPTPVSTLEKAYEIAKKMGIKYVYLGNVPGHRYENTYCHNCGKLLLERSGFAIFKNRLSDGRCPNCNTKVPIIEYLPFDQAK